MEILKLLVHDFILYILPTFLTTVFVGIISWPSVKVFFGRFSDKGYTVSLLLGVWVVAYGMFSTALVTKLPILTTTNIYLAFALWAFINLVLEVKFKLVRRDLNLKQTLVINTTYLGLLLFWYIVKGHIPDFLMQEKYMEFGIIKSLFNSTQLPLKDFWMAGENLNYYYFSHFISYVLLSLMHMDPDPGLYMIAAWVFSLACLLSFRLGKDISKGLNLGFHNAAGLLSMFFTIFAGTADTVFFAFKYISALLLGQNLPIYLHNDTSRTIENSLFLLPFQSFLEFDLHSHVWGIVATVLVLSLLYLFLVKKEENSLYAIPILLAFALLLHPWDVVTLFVMTGVSMLLFKPAFGSILHLLIILCGFQVLASPFTSSFTDPTNGIGRVENPSDLMSWLIIWGFFCALSVLFVLYTKQELRTETLQSAKFIKSMLAVNFAFLTLIEVFYVKDAYIGEPFYRFNTFFKASSIIWVVFGILAGPMTLFLASKKRLYVWLLTGSMLFFSFYPLSTLNYIFRANEFLGFSYTNIKWMNKYPQDFEAFLHLKSKYGKEKRMFVIAESYGPGYQLSNMFSTFLGWSAVIGWEEHEQTWRDNSPEILQRQAVIDELYTGTDPYLAYDIVDYYQINFILVGQRELELYKDSINFPKLFQLGDIEYLKNNTVVIRTAI